MTSIRGFYKYCISLILFNLRVKYLGQCHHWLVPGNNDINIQLLQIGMFVRGLLRIEIDGNYIGQIYYRKVQNNIKKYGYPMITAMHVCSSFVKQ